MFTDHRAWLKSFFKPWFSLMHKTVLIHIIFQNTNDLSHKLLLRCMFFSSQISQILHSLTSMKKLFAKPISFFFFPGHTSRLHFSKESMWLNARIKSVGRNDVCHFQAWLTNDPPYPPHSTFLMKISMTTMVARGWNGRATRWKVPGSLNHYLEESCLLPGIFISDLMCARNTLLFCLSWYTILSLF